MFILNWFTMPILNGFLAAGDFTAKEKLMRALRKNIPMIIFSFVAFIAIIICLAVTDSGRIALQK